MAKDDQARRALKYPEIKMATIQPCDDMRQKAFDEAKTIMGAYPNVKLIMAICTPAVPGAAEAVKQAHRDDVKVIGLGLPNENKTYVHEGITPAVILWKTVDLGYLTVRAAYAVKKGTIEARRQNVRRRPPGNDGNQGTDIILGTPFTFTKEISTSLISDA